MNGFPHDELLSAYLDDELSPAERAEVEKLLATDPAARRSLEQLRAVSEQVRSLPRQNLGEDLSKHALELAQQRRLQTSPVFDTSDDPASPLPTGEPFARRLLSRRNLLWLSLTAAIAVLISVHERWNPAELGRDRKVAVAPAKTRWEGLNRPLPPSSIQAPAEAKRDQPADQFAASEAEALPAAPSAAAPAAPEPPAARTDRFYAPALAETASDALHEARPQGKTSPIREKTATTFSAAPAAETPFVIHCQITPAAAQRNALQNLLAANDITWNQRDFSIKNAPPRAAEKHPQRDDVPGQSAAKQRQDKDAVAAAPTQFHAQATGEQLQNVLAALAAQPEYFVAVTLQPPHQRKAQVVFDQRNRNLNQRLLGGAALSQRQPADAANPRQEAAPPPTVLNRTTGAQSDREANVRPQAEDVAPTQAPAQQSQAAANARRQTVLFVIRVVDLPNAAPAPEAK